MLPSLTILLSICCLAELTDGARILASVATPSYSHQVAFRTIWKELADRGHEVVLLTTDPIEGNIENFRQIDLRISYEVLKMYNYSSFVSNNSSNNYWNFMRNVVVSMAEAQKYQLLHPEVQTLIHNVSEYFDLFMMEIIYPIHIGFVERFKVPVIGLASFDVPSTVHSLMGNDDHAILHPTMGFTTSIQPTLLDRTGIKKFLDSASNGAIYFSLGSNVKSALLRDDLRQVFIETLKDLPYKILWKFEDEELPNKPDNVMIQKWVPQGDVLRHPNIKAFITQCGLQSMEEAIMNHVPLVGLPFFADQPANALIMENKGFGISLDQTKLTKEQFKETIIEVVTNPKYKQKAIEIADLSTDVEMTGLEKVVWWTEYVIRNKGAKLLKNPIRDLPLYQYYLLDVIGFVGLICFIVIFGVVKISSFLYGIVRHLIVKKLKKD